MSENAYIYDAEIYCEDCGEKIREEITKEGHAPTNPDDERSYDSGEFPKGAYPNGGGEADTPQHCANCQKSLGNDLTAEGVRYVLEALRENLRCGRGTQSVLRGWAEQLKDYGQLTAAERILASEFVALIDRESSLVATFTPEAWINDNACEVDPEGDTTWNCWRFLRKIGLLDDVQRAIELKGEWLDRDDRLQNDEAAPQWIRDWSGPFTIRVTSGEK